MRPGAGYRSEAGFIGGPGYAGPAAYDEDDRYVGTVGGSANMYGLYKNASTGGITSEEEKNHVIKVLEHESKVYKFEKNLVSLLGGNDFDVYSEKGRSPRPRNAGFDF